MPMKKSTVNKRVAAYKRKQERLYRESQRKAKAKAKKSRKRK